MLNGYKTYIGLIVALIGTVAPLFGYSISPEFAGQFSDIADKVIVIVGLLFAAYGRAKAVVPGWFAKKS